MSVISFKESEDAFFCLTSDNPVVFWDEHGKRQPLWTVPFSTFRGFMFPVSSTRLFVSYFGDGLPPLVKSNNTLQRLQARETVFTDKSKEDLLIAECQHRLPDSSLTGVDQYHFDFNVVCSDGTRVPMKGLILTVGKAIWVVGEGGKRHPVNTAARELNPSVAALGLLAVMGLDQK